MLAISGVAYFTDCCKEKHKFVYYNLNNIILKEQFKFDSLGPENCFHLT